MILKMRENEVTTNNNRTPMYGLFRHFI